MSLDQYGMAVMQERHHDRRHGALENYLRMEYGSTSGMGQYIAEANHSSSPRSGLRAFLARIAGVVSRPSIRATPAVSVKPALSEDCADHAAPRPQAAAALRVRPVGQGRGLNVRPRTVVPPLKR
ncbi:MAG: hypothetical protein V3W28_02470 [Thermoplasmata archaeon]